MVNETKVKHNLKFVNLAKEIYVESKKQHSHLNINKSYILSYEFYKCLLIDLIST